MSLGAAVRLPAAYARAVVMRIDPAISPTPSPPLIVDEYIVSSPVKAVVAPSPGTERQAQAHAEPEADCSTHVKAWSGRCKYQCWVVRWHHYISWIHRLDFDVRAAGHPDSIIAAQVAVIPRLLPLSLNRIHHVLPLRQKRIAQIAGPVHVRSHCVEYRGKRKQRLHAGIPGQMIFGNCTGHFVSA